MRIRRDSAFLHSGDRSRTAGLLAERFGAQAVASAGTIEQMRLHVSIREIFWVKLWPGQIPPSPGKRHLLD
jgi:hypothetical protein